VLWALHPTDPELNTAVWHENRRGGKALRLKTAAAHSPPRDFQDARYWDVKLNQVERDNINTDIGAKYIKNKQRKIKIDILMILLYAFTLLYDFTLI